MELKLRSTIQLLFLLVSITIFSQKTVWKKSLSQGELHGHSLAKLEQENSEVLKLNFSEFKNQLKGAPLRGVTISRSQTIINLPDENGKLQSFTIYEAPVFSASLSAKYPEIKSYVGYSNDNSEGVVRMSVSHRGVQTMISYKDRPTVFMQPIHGDEENYIVYNRLSKNNLPKEDFICSTADELVKETGATNITQRDANDQILRKFRIAVSVNGEYTTYHGGTVAGALAAVNATLARVNAVFEVDMAITFELQDFPELIYTNAATDPYSGSLANWNLELQNTLSNVIGNDAYDIGHMFGASGGGGNAGCIGCVCRDDDTANQTDQNKGSGITSPANGVPQGDTFDIDYVAHEIGHQMGANHTFSHNTEGAGVNAEPGSGSTIMGYAGITSSNVQQNSDPYFHYHSIRQITDNVTNTRLCWQANSPVNLTNNPPDANAGSDYTIPQGTAYVLRGSATDADSGDTLTYCWEQTDNGQVTRTQFGPTRTVGAQARSLPPTTVTDRYIPKLTRVIAGQLTETNPNSGDDWETVSTVSRDLNWALTVRDREPTATGLNGQSSFDLMKVTVDATAGPFTVTSQTTNEVWEVGSNQTVTWDVAGTNAGNVNTPTVNIKMSVDGGVTFPHTLATNVANDGSHEISVPATGGDTTQARVMVEGNNNIFYAVNSSNFSTQESEFALTVADTSAESCYPADATYNITYNTFLGFTGVTTFSALNLPTGASISFNPATATADGTSVVATVSGIVNLATGDYNFTLQGTSGSIVKSANVTLKVLTGTFGAINLTSPSNAATGIGLSPMLEWDADANAQSYDVEIATDSGFTSIITSANVTSNSYVASGLMQATQYFWRVKPKNTCGEGAFSTAFSFTTETCSACASSGNTTYGTATTLVNFNTINNATTKLDNNGTRQGYFDYTSISTTVDKGMSYDLTVNADTDGTYTTHTIVWVDWNQDCDFDDAGEQYDMGTTTTQADGATTLSPLSIVIPNDALDGNTTMRVSTRFNADATSCQTGFDGEVEDYTVEVQSPSASVDDFSFSNFSLYPNPSNGELNLSFKVVDTDNVSVQLYDIRGRKVGENKFNNVSPQFSERLVFDNISSGIYLLNIINGGKQSTKKIVIE